MPRQSLWRHVRTGSIRTIGITRRVQNAGKWTKLSSPSARGSPNRKGAPIKVRLVGRMGLKLNNSIEASFAGRGRLDKAHDSCRTGVSFTVHDRAPINKIGRRFQAE